MNKVDTDAIDLLRFAWRNNLQKQPATVGEACDAN